MSRKCAVPDCVHDRQTPLLAVPAKDLKGVLRKLQFPPNFKPNSRTLFCENHFTEDSVMTIGIYKKNEKLSMLSILILQFYWTAS